MSNLGYLGAKLSQELFEKTNERQFYDLGIAIGLFSVYEHLDEINDEEISVEKLLNYIDSLANSEEGFNKYFEIFLEDLEQCKIKKIIDSKKLNEIIKQFDVVDINFEEVPEELSVEIQQEKDEIVL